MGMKPVPTVFATIPFTTFFAISSPWGNRGLFLSFSSACADNSTLYTIHSTLTAPLGD